MAVVSLTDNTVVKARICFSKSTYEDWIENDPVLYQGELAVVTDIPGEEDSHTYRFKIGDGITSFSELKWYSQTTKLSKDTMGIPFGVATLDDIGKIPMSQLPEMDSELFDGFFKSSLLRTPIQRGTIPYDGKNHHPDWYYYNSDMMILSGELCGRDPKTYSVTAQPRTGYTWADGASEPRIVFWEIESTGGLMLPQQINIPVYDSMIHVPEFSYYNSDTLSMTGDKSGVNAGTYTAIFKPTGSSEWKDSISSNPHGSIPVTWIIKRCPIPKPTLKPDIELVYNGKSQSPSFNGYPNNNITVSGTQSATNSGEYTVTFSVGSNYCWADESTTPVTVKWKIEDAPVNLVPTQSGTLTYNGSEQSPTWIGYNTDLMTISGTQSATNAGAYTVTFSLKSNELFWDDFTSDPKTATWSINTKKISVSDITQTGKQEYSGNSIVPTFSGYDSSIMTMTGDTSATNAGKYSVDITITNDNYEWEDN